MTSRPWTPKLPKLSGALTAVLATLALSGLLSLTTVVAQDPPHWVSTSIDINCTTQCHTPHHAPGNRLTAAANNVNLCQACHNPAGLASALPLNSADAAQRGITGTSHAFNVPAIQDFDGDGIDDVVEPDPLINKQMSLRILGGNVVCSTCHNQHRSESGFGGNSRIGDTHPVQVDPATTGSIGTTGEFTGPVGLWYLVEIVNTGNEGNTEFRFSKDNGLSWLPNLCSPGNLGPCLTSNGAVPVDLDNGVQVVFATGSYTQGDRWEFSAAWPFLRETLDTGDNTSADRFCRDCHRAWVMDTAAVGTFDGTIKSHPVGVSFPTNPERFHSFPLDGNGQAQNGAGATADVDGNPTNDYRFDGSGNLQCLTCHGIHFVDSNTQTVDMP